MRVSYTCHRRASPPPSFCHARAAPAPFSFSFSVSVSFCFSAARFPDRGALLALLVQQHLLYWYKSTNTDTFC